MLVTGQSMCSPSTRIEWHLHGLLRRDFVVAARRELYVVPTWDKVIAKTIFCSGEYDFPKVELALKFMNRSFFGTFVDVGANVGSVCIPTLARGLAQKAIAVEAHPMNLALLRANLALNEVGEMTTVIAGAAARPGTTRVSLRVDGRNSGGHSVIPKQYSSATASDQVLEVLGLALDDHAIGLNPVSDIIWMDIQGYEIEALRGATGLLSSSVTFMISTCPEMLTKENYSWLQSRVLPQFAHFVNLDDPHPTLQTISKFDSLAEILMKYGTEADVLFLPRHQPS